MKIVGIIPARFASSRFPGKPLIDLKGKTMIQRVYEGVKQASSFSQVIVATDDQRIVDEVKRFGGEVMMTKSSHVTGTDRCGEIALQVDADVIVNIQGDEPLVSSAQLDTLCNAFRDKNTKIATLGIKGVSEDDLKNPNRIKIVEDKNNNALYFSRSPIPNSHHGSDQIVKTYPYVRHIGLYAYRKETLLEIVQLKRTALETIESLEQLRWLYNGYRIKVVETDIETPNIDTPEDVEAVLRFL
ncbi:MAG: 3-deoxy-manno-octulosonate cytidylyltransferase [Crocinitomicaceae bacterium]|nr:3-deoxy-manno-octulosonate cytidylyltransferase [Crocinitomicaceae bacterium]